MIARIIPLLLLLMISTTVEAKEFFVFLNRPPKPLEISRDSTTMLEDKYIDHITGWQSSGIVTFYAVFERGGAVLIINGSSKDEVLDTLMTDEALRMGMYIPEIYPMTVLRGKVCGSDGDMLLYQSVRLIARMDAPKLISKETAMPQLEQWLQKIEEKANILLFVRFDDSNSGGFVIGTMKRASVSELTLAPIPDNIFSTRIRNLWARNGVFCTTTE